MLVKHVKRGGAYFPARNISIGDMQFDMGLSEYEVIKAVASSKNLRLKNLAAAINTGPKNDMIVANQFYVNNSYGSHVERGSSVTIVNPLGRGDNGLSYFDWHVAQLGGFNYVANELFSRTHPDPACRCNFYVVTDPDHPEFQKYINDITNGRGKNDWIVIIAGEQVVKNTQYDFHFELGGERGETSFDFEGCIPWDGAAVQRLYEDFSRTLEEKLEMKTDLHDIQPKVSKYNVARYIKERTEANVQDAILAVAEILSNHLETNKPKGLHKEEYKVVPEKSEYWRSLYLQDLG